MPCCVAVPARWPGSGRFGLLNVIGRVSMAVQPEVDAAGVSDGEQAVEIRRPCRRDWRKPVERQIG